MPRANEKPFPCEDCRFNIGDVCRRNPPTAGSEIEIPDEDLIYTVYWRKFPYVGDGCSCFAGEPLVERSCRNCRHVDGSLCTLHWFSICERLKQKPNWHCCDWEEGE